MVPQRETKKKTEKGESRFVCFFGAEKKKKMAGLDGPSPGTPAADGSLRFLW